MSVKLPVSGARVQRMTGIVKECFQEKVVVKVLSFK